MANNTLGSSAVTIVISECGESLLCLRHELSH